MHCLVQDRCMQLQQVQKGLSKLAWVQSAHAYRQEQHWIAQRMETQRDLEPQARLALLKELVEADAFERFLALKFPGTKVLQALYALLLMQSS